VQEGVPVVPGARRPPRQRQERKGRVRAGAGAGAASSRAVVQGSPRRERPGGPRVPVLLPRVRVRTGPGRPQARAHAVRRARPAAPVPLDGSSEMRRQLHVHRPQRAGRDGRRLRALRRVRHRVRRHQTVRPAADPIRPILTATTPTSDRLMLLRSCCGKGLGSLPIHARIRRRVTVEHFLFCFVWSVTPLRLLVWQYVPKLDEQYIHILFVLL
jgi:hypothetical protein